MNLIHFLVLLTSTSIILRFRITLTFGIPQWFSNVILIISQGFSNLTGTWEKSIYFLK